MLKLTLYNPFHCPDECKEENQKKIEAILKSTATFLAEKAFIKYALSDPETIKIETEDFIKVKIKDKIHTLKCDFKLYFTNGVIGYSESNGIIHFIPRSTDRPKDYKNRLVKFTYKQRCMKSEGKNILNINFITNITGKEGFILPQREKAYKMAVTSYTASIPFKMAYNKLKNPHLKENINMTVSFNDVFIMRKCGVAFADQYMQSLLDTASFKYIERIYEEPKTVTNSYRFG